MNLLWNKADTPSAILILAHGAGAAMDSDFMEIMAAQFCEQGITIVRFEFPHMQERRSTGKKRPPDRQPKLLESWKSALDEVRNQTRLPIYIGGKSMGGRMATLLIAEGVEVPGVVCLGYPFYAAGKKDRPRIEHLQNINASVLIVQGDRDAMGDRETVESYPLSEKIKLAWLEDGNHDLKPRKASGLTHEGHMISATNLVVEFINQRQ